MTRSDEMLRQHFSTVVANAGTTGAIGEISSLLSKGNLEAASFAEVLKEHGLNREPWFRVQRLDLVLGYVEALLAEGGIQAGDLQSISSLKKRLGVEEGDFISLRPAEVAAVLTRQLEQILADDVVEESEDLRKGELQAVFDLSYDQLLQLTRVEIERAMASLTERLVLARADHNTDLGRLLALRIAALDPIYRLAVSQPRRLGALY